MTDKHFIGMVSLRDRFRRAARLDAGSRDFATALDGYVCPQSIALSMLNMAQMAQNGAAAFNWTGNYGVGKTSAALLLSALLCGKSRDREMARRLLGANRADAVRDGLLLNGRARTLLPVISSADGPEADISAAMCAAGLADRAEARRMRVSRGRIFEALAAAPKGVLLVVDEMGSYLEAAVAGNQGIRFWQDLAECAEQSGGRLLFVGILHQSFDAYAGNLGESARREWQKIRGRFADIMIEPAPEEQVSLIARAIQSRQPLYPEINRAAIAVARHYCGNRNSAKFAQTLEKCRPLHPATALILGAGLSRAGFSQTLRSVFGFLNSAEPFGFRDFVDDGGDVAYAPWRLWDYLDVNLGQAIAHSGDGHRWAVGADCVRRAQSLDEETVEKCAKTVALLDFFRGTRLPANVKIVTECVGGGKRAVEKSLTVLTQKSILVYRRHSDRYLPFEGSDFDIDAEMRAAVAELPDETDFEAAAAESHIRPIIARRESFMCGATRWFKVGVVQISKYKRFIADAVSGNHNGLVVLVLPDNGKQTLVSCRKVIKADGFRLPDGRPVIAAVPDNAEDFCAAATEVLGLRRVASAPVLQGDPIARREIEARAVLAAERMRREVTRAFSRQKWLTPDGESVSLSANGMSDLVSSLVKETYHRSPKIRSELVNVSRLSASAMGALRCLMRAMVNSADQKRLGIEGYPPHGALYDILLEQTTLHRPRQSGGYFFATPDASEDPTNLSPLWEKTKDFLAQRDGAVKVGEVYKMWDAPPFGVENGLKPFLALAFALSLPDEIAVYMNGAFRPALDEVDAERIAMMEQDFLLRLVPRNAASRSVFATLAECLPIENCATASPLAVARGLVSWVNALPPWALRTRRASATILKFRDILRRADDPYRLIFDDLPQIFVSSTGDKTKRTHLISAAQVKKAMRELEEFQSKHLTKIRQKMLSKLGASDDAAKRRLPARAAAIAADTGDLRVRAFAQRLANLAIDDDDRNAMAPIVALAAGRADDAWTDLDIQKAEVTLTELCVEFMRVEMFGESQADKNGFSLRVDVRKINGKASGDFRKIALSNRDYAEVQDLAKQIRAVLRGKDAETGIAAIAQAGIQAMRDARRNR